MLLLSISVADGRSVWLHCMFICVTNLCRPMLQTTKHQDSRVLRPGDASKSCVTTIHQDYALLYTHNRFRSYKNCHLRRENNKMMHMGFVLCALISCNYYVPPSHIPFFRGTDFLHHYRVRHPFTNQWLRETWVAIWMGQPLVSQNQPALLPCHPVPPPLSWSANASDPSCINLSHINTR